MDHRTALLATLEGKSLRHPVWTADISYWISGNAKTELESETGYLDFCRDLGCMPYYWYDAFWAAKRRFPDGAVSITREDGTIRTTWTTPSGRSLFGVDRYSETSWSQATIKYPVTNVDELESLIDLLEASPLEPTPALTNHRSRRDRWESYGGIPSIGLPRSPLSALINEWAGVEHGLMLLFDAPKLCVRLFSLLERQEAPILEACIEQRVPLVHFPDNLTSEVYTSVFEEAMRETYEHRLSMLHSGGVKAAVHLDGTVAGLLPRLATTGIDAVEAVTPGPVGDCSAEEMRRMVSGTHTVLWGGVPGAMFAPPYTWQEMKLHVESVLAAWSDIPYVLGVADQVPPDGDIELVRRIAELVEEIQ